MTQATAAKPVVTMRWVNQYGAERTRAEAMADLDAGFGVLIGEVVDGEHRPLFGLAQEKSGCRSVFIVQGTGLPRCIVHSAGEAVVTLEFLFKDRQEMGV